jgi:ABC-type sugar transport system ATPase subunit
MDMNIPDNGLLIEARNISKKFSGIKVLDNVSFSLKKGEIHCLCGENGAGKSTLIKVLSGAYVSDGGEMCIDGQVFRNNLTPLLARHLGIEVIHQEIILVKQLSVAENIYPDARFTKHGFFSFKKTCEEARKLIGSLGIVLDPREKVENLSTADQQFVKILKALAPNPRILIMDEPTAMFNMKDTDVVLKLVKDIRDRGIGIIYISHHLKEIKRIADKVTVLRDGLTVASYAREDIDLGKLASDMVGRPVDMFYKREVITPGDVIYEIKGLKLTKDSPTIDFSLRQGEILGITGMVSSERSEIIRAIFGLDPRYAGEIYIRGRKTEIKKPSNSIRNSIGFISEDRQRSGLVLPLDITVNTTLLKLPMKGGFIDLFRERAIAGEYIEKLEIKTRGPNQTAARLSGGNQQKVIIAKWLHKGFDILILDEPTKGIDVNAKFEIYKLLHELTKQGKSLLIVSSDMPEIVSMCNRVIIIKEGHMESVISGDEITEENILKRSVEVA